MELSKLSAIELRKVATNTYGVKGAAKHSKAALLEMCEAIEAERAAAAVAERAAIEAAEIMAERAEMAAEKFAADAADAMPARAGTPRAGMRMHVAQRASGAEKAEQIKTQVLTLAPGAACTIDVSKKAGVVLTVALDGLSIRLAWSAAGPYAYDHTSIEREGRKPVKVRNASAALKAIAAHAEARPVAEPIAEAQMAEAA